MRVRRLGNFMAAAVVASSALFNVAYVSVANAAAVSWDGGAGNFDLSAPANWAGDTLPTAADDATINVGSFSANATFTNSSPLAVNSLVFSGTKSGDWLDLKVTGSTITVGSAITESAANTSVLFATDITLAGNTTFTGFEADYNTPAQTVNLNGNNLTIAAVTGATYSSFNKITGTGAVTVTGSASASLNEANTGWSGALNVNADARVYLDPGAVAASNSITIADTGYMALCGFNGATVNSPLTVGGNGSGYGAIATAPGCNMGAPSTGLDPKASVVWAGSVTLTANTVVSGSGEFKVTGPLSGSFTITQAGGTDGKVTVASSSNTSGTPNGEYASQTKTTEYKDNNPTEFIYVGSNNVAIVDGTYGDTSVLPGGILKGTGTVAMLDVAAGGTVAPGHSPGCLNTGNLNLQGRYEFELLGATACTQHDQIKVTGTVTFDPATAELSTVILPGYTATAGQKYVIISNDGTDAVTGTFKGLAEGATFAAGNGGQFRISYVGGDGNDVELTVLTVPTAPDTGFTLLSANPALTAVVAVLGAGALLLMARRARA